MLERYLPLTATPIRETDKAVLIHMELNDIQIQEIWLPKSVLHDDSKSDIEAAVRGEELELYVAEWWLQENT